MVSRPNIVQITTHDSGRHFGCYGHPTLHTPVIDALAASGVRMTHYFAAVPICSASRVCQLTGLYPQTHGLMDLTGYGWRMKPEVKHLSQLLKAAGYRTALIGTQHEVQPDEVKTRLAFDEVVQGRAAAGVALEAAYFLGEAAKGPKPFYAQIGFNETHTPFSSGGAKPDTSLGLEIPPYLADTPAAREAMAGFQGAIRKVDEAVGVIIEAVRANGLENNTIFIFTTDHGIEMPRSKWFLYDPGIAIALIVRYPGGGVTGGRRCDRLASNVDYVPTVLELAGLDVPAGLQGRSFAGSLRGEDAAPAREAVFALYHKTQSRCARTDRFKLIRYFDSASDFAAVPVRCEDVLRKRVIKRRMELFDLTADPNEFHNVVDRPEYADAQRQLDAMLWQWMESVEDPLLKGPVRTPTYEASIREYAGWKSGQAGRGSQGRHGG